MAAKRKVARHQLVRPAALDDAPVLDHQHAVHPPYRVEPMRDDEQRTAGRQRRDRARHQRGRVGVEARAGLVEHHHVGVGEEDARQRDALDLAARQALPAVPHGGVEAQRQRGDETARAGGVQRAGELRRGGVRAGEEEVVAQRAVEQRRPLRQPGDAAHPARARQAVRRSTPSTRIRPAEGWAKPSRSWPSVVFPAPEGPTSATRSPRAMRKPTSWITGASAA